MRSKSKIREFSISNWMPSKLFGEKVFETSEKILALKQESEITRQIIYEWKEAFSLAEREKIKVFDELGD